MTEFDYRPMPFWFWNHRLEKEEVELQVRLMAEAGCGGFFIHPRAGLKTPYLSEAWFEAVGWAIDAAEKHGIKAWLYDEDPFPSGAVGGQVFFEHPEFMARSIRFYELEADDEGLVEGDVGKGIILEAWGFRRDCGGTVIEKRELANCVGVVRPDYFMSPWDSSYYAQIFGKTPFPHYRGECFYPRNRFSCRLAGDGWQVYVVTAEVMPGTEKYGGMPDNLNRECVKYFINKTHEEYRRRFGDKFGTVIPGVFTDEPAMGGNPPWTGALEKCFLGEHGYSLRGNYHGLFIDDIDGDASKLRRDYWHTVDGLFARNYFGQIRSWCRRNKLLLTGHCIGEENPVASTGGTSLSALQKYFDIPGFDHITGNIPNGDFQSLNFGGKLIASAAARAGKRQVMSECFACNPFNFGTDGMGKISNWLFSMGINVLVPHGFFYSYDGFRKYDAGKSFFFQDPDFPRFREFAVRVAGIGRMLGESVPVGHLCLIVPMDHIRSRLTANPEMATKLAEVTFAAVKHLIERQIQFEIADEATLLQSHAEGGLIHCGRQTYSEVLFVADSPELFAWCDSRMISYSIFPQFQDKLETLCGLADLDADPDSRSAMSVHIRKGRNGLLACLFNNRRETSRFRFRWKNCGQCFIYEPVSGDYYCHDAAAMLDIAPFDTIIICNKAPKNANIVSTREFPSRQPGSFSYESAPQWDYLPPVDGLLCNISEWNVSAGSVNHVRQRFCLLRDLVGTELPHMRNQRPRPIFDRAEPIPSVYPMAMSFSTEFHLPENIPARQELYLLWESETIGGSHCICINGNPLPEGQRLRVYDPWNLAVPLGRYCRPGSNRLEIAWESAGEFDGLRGAMYVITRDI